MIPTSQMSDVREQIEEVGIRDRARADELNVCIEQIAQQVPVGLRVKIRNSPRIDLRRNWEAQRRVRKCSGRNSCGV